MNLLRTPPVTFLPLAICFFLCLVFPVFAAEIISVRSSESLGVGDEFIVSFVLDAKGESINALEGEIQYPRDILTLKEVRDGNSIVNLWVERPHEQNGTIRFAGVTPGGFGGGNGELFAVVFSARLQGEANFSLSGTRALLNDGKGSPTTLRLYAAPLSIAARGNGASVAPMDLDHTEPESFVPSLGSDPSLFDGKWFVAFATQDKESGVDHYEVAERVGFRFPLFQKLDWRNATSPFVLSDQSQSSYIYVKAVDRSGNSVITRLSPVHAPFYFSDITLVAILLVLIGTILFYVRKRGTLQTH